MVKIVSGEFKGRVLKSFKGNKTRPTLEKVRDCIFNVLSSRFDLGRFQAVDLFAGTGAMGLEAVSRGCDSAIFVEKDAAAAEIVRKNIDLLGLNLPVTTANALTFLRKRKWRGGYFLFFLDPPYGSNFGAEAIEILTDLAEDLSCSVAVLESSVDSTFDLSRGLRVFQRKRFGATRIDFFTISRTPLKDHPRDLVFPPL